MAFLNDRDPNDRAAVPDRVVERRVVERRAVPLTATRVELAPSPARASWSGIWGGFLLACGIFLVLATLVLAIGASSLNIGAGQPFNLASVGKGTAVWLYIVMLVALFFGGLFGSRVGMVVDSAIAWFEGSLIWVFGMIAVTLLVGVGAGVVVARAPGSILSAASLVRTGAWLTFVGMIVAWIVTVLGSFVGRAAARDRAVELGMLRAA